MNLLLFNLGPLVISIWSLVVIVLLILVAFILRKIINRRLKQYLANANLKVEGQKTILIRLVGQLVFIVVGYLIFLILRYQNPTVSFRDIIEHKIIDSQNFDISFSHIISVLLVFFVAKIAIRFTQLIITQRLRNKKDYDPGLEFVYVQFSKYIIYILAIMIASKIVFSNISALLTGSFGILVGIGLGLQDVFKDFIAGIVLMVERNLMVGDVIEIPDSTHSQMLVAKVVKIGVRTSKIETRDGNVLILPNTQLSQNRVENWTHGNTMSRFFVEAFVSYGADTDLVVKLLRQAALSHPQVSNKEDVTVRLAEFAESSLRFELIFWADQSWTINNVRSDIRMEIDRLFRQYKLNIPFPQLDIHIASDKRPMHRKTGHYDEQE